jgi:hypothetical protein
MIVTIFTETMENEIGKECGAFRFVRPHRRVLLNVSQGAHDLVKKTPGIFS